MLPEMNSGELTSEQIKVLQEQLKPHFLYLKRLLERMEQRGFNPTDFWSMAMAGLSPVTESTSGFFNCSKKFLA